MALPSAYQYTSTAEGNRAQRTLTNMKPQDLTHLWQRVPTIITKQQERCLCVYVYVMSFFFGHIGTAATAVFSTYYFAQWLLAGVLHT